MKRSKRVLAAILSCAMLIGTAVSSMALDRDNDGFGSEIPVILPDSPPQLATPQQQVQGGGLSDPKANLPVYIKTESIPSDISAKAIEEFRDMTAIVGELFGVTGEISLHPGIKAYGDVSTISYFFPISMNGRFEIGITIFRDPTSPDGFTSEIAYTPLVSSLNELRGECSIENPYSFLHVEEGMVSVSEKERDIHAVEIYHFEGQEPATSFELEERALNSLTDDRNLFEIQNSGIVTLDSVSAIDKQYLDREVNENLIIQKRFLAAGYSNGNYTIKINGTTYTKGMCWAAAGMMLYSARTTGQASITFDKWKTDAEAATGKIVGKDGFNHDDVRKTLQRLNRNVSTISDYNGASDAVYYLDASRPLYVAYRNSTTKNGHARLLVGYGYGKDTKNFKTIELDPNTFGTTLPGMYTSSTTINNSLSTYLKYRDGGKGFVYGGYSFFTTGEATG